MSLPIQVELVSHDPAWAHQVAEESKALAVAIGPCLQIVHHIGSTSIPGIRAKPILDLLPVIMRHAQLEDRRRELEGLGYVWRGEYGLPGRRYCTKSHPVSGARLIHLHCYEGRHPDVIRSLAFRNYLRAHSEIAAAYEGEKIRCQRLHSDDSRAYADCKSAWIKRTEAEALAWSKVTGYDAGATEAAPR
jgi:GrpB-like predicted nucleotidyltransferase (UPF0157 family)